MKILDNVNNLWGDDLKRSLKNGVKLKIAASCFSIYAYEALKNELEQIGSLEFIFTEPTFVPEKASDKISKHHKEFFIPKQQRERNLYGSEFEIQLKNKLTQRAIAKECADWIRRKAKYKSNSTARFMQNFACINELEEDVVYAPINGFSAVDLGYQQGNAVSNIVNKLEDAPITNTYLQLFDQIWSDPSQLEDVTENICSHIESVYKENSPEKIYFFILFNIFNDFLDDINEDVLPNDLTGYQDSIIWNKLFNFQRDAAVGIINKLENYNGCILADSVGLGKTFTALAVIKYYELRNRSVLVLCPKKLSENWTNYNSNLKTNPITKDRLNYDVLCHTDLQRTTGTSNGISLARVNWGNYDLVVIDESHNFRNNEIFKEHETRYQRLLNSVIRDGVETKVLMLSATPVNNRFNDLKNQLALAYEGHSENLSNKLKTQKSIDEIFRQAQKSFNQWSKLPPEERTAEAILDSLEFDFFELLDSVTIARSRKHIETFYDINDIGSFPNRLKPKAFHCPLTMRDDVIKFNEIYEQLTGLKLSIYTPTNFIFSSRRPEYEKIYDTDVEGGRKLRQSDRENSLKSLMTTNLLKRLESSVESFRITLNSLEQNHEILLMKIEKFKKDESGSVSLDEFEELLRDLESEDDDLSDLDDYLTGGKIKVRLEDMDLESWERDLRHDLDIIKYLLKEMDKVEPKDDAKLQQLIADIKSKISKPLNRQNRKVLLFTAFADTANYLYKNLAHIFLELGIHSGRVTGKDAPKTTLGKKYDYQSVLILFSPKSNDKDLIMPEVKGEIDLLIGTDCISEGQNLQDCDYVINYDIHWNPVRIIQRFGRIDRIGSTNESIQLVNFWPDISLDEYIKLRERVENRMVIVDVSGTGDDNVLTAKANDVAYRKEQLRRLQDEVIELEELKTGVNITDLGLNDFRMDLLGYLKSNGDLSGLPSGLHAVIPSKPEIGLSQGIIFALRNRNHSINVNQQNRLHPYYLVYINMNGEVIVRHTEVKHLLDIIRTGCKGFSEPVLELCRCFNQETDDGRKMSRYSELLSKAIATMIDVKEEKDIDSLFSGRKTTALVDAFKGLDDFELIAFLVIQDVDS